MFKKLLSSNKPLDIYIVARWMYKIGNPVFQNDKDFDKYESILKKMYPNLAIFRQSYDDDDEPVELLQMYGISEVQKTNTNNTLRVSKYLDMLLDNRSMSIRPIRMYEEAYQWFQSHIGVELIFMTKMDGVNIKSIVDTKRGKFEVAASRARKENSILRDYTAAVVQKYPMKLKKNYFKNPPELMPVYFEGFMDEAGRLEMNSRYNKQFVNAKTAGFSALVLGVEEDLLDNLRIYAFSANDGSDTLSESIDRLEASGLNTVPYLVETYSNMDFNQFKIWIDNIQKQLNDYSDSVGIVYDGVVVQLNNWLEFEKCESDGMYSDGNIALKFGENASEEYTAFVSDIKLIFEGKSKEQYTTKLFINPIVTGDNKEISVISGYNLANIIERNIVVGSEIKILYQSGCDPILK